MMMKYQSGGGKEASNEVEEQPTNNGVSNEIESQDPEDEVEVGGGEEASNDEVSIRRRRNFK